MKRAYTIRRSRAAGWARLCGGLAVPVLVLAAIGTRAGLIPAPALLPVLIVGFLLGLSALGIALYALIDIWNNGAEGTGSAVAGIVYALPALSVLGLIAAAAIAYPRLTDVSTNFKDPPEFADEDDPILPLRSAELQQAAYPDLVTRSYPLPLGEVYAATRAVMEDRNWTIVDERRPLVMPETLPSAAAPQTGESEELLRILASKAVMTQSRGVTTPLPGEGETIDEEEGNVATLEATAPTLVFGFRDHVIVRLRGTPEGTELDIRSASGMGEHDLGQNARRIRGFFAALDAVLKPGADG